MIYRILRLLVGLGIKLYYKEINIKNTKVFDHDGPMIIIANHPNTLMDAWMIGYACPKPIYFMAKSTFFNSSFKRKILKSLNMIPINRQVDGKIKGINNADSFEACYQLLEEGKTLVVFPEGTSIPERKLRELKSGTARIALEAEARNNGQLNLKIVPIGLFYSQAEKFRSSVLISIENGLFATDFLTEYSQNASLAAKKLTKVFRLHLERVLISTENKTQEELLHKLFAVFWARKRDKVVSEEVKLMKEIQTKLEEIQLLKPYLMNEIQDLLQVIEWQTRKLAIHTDFIHRRFRSRLYLIQLSLSIFFLLVGFPFFVFGLINNFIQYKLVDFLVPKLTKFVEFYAAVGVLLSFIIYPLFYSGLFYGADKLFHMPFIMDVIYSVSLPLSGLYAYSFARYLKRIGYKWKYIFLIFNQREAVKELQHVQTSLLQLIND